VSTDKGIAIARAMAAVKTFMTILLILRYAVSGGSQLAAVPFRPSFDLECARQAGTSGICTGHMKLRTRWNGRCPIGIAVDAALDLGVRLCGFNRTLVLVFVCAVRGVKAQPKPDTKAITNVRDRHG